MKKLIEKMTRVVCLFLMTLTGIFGLIMAMGEECTHLNFVGVMIFAFVCFFGSQYAHDGLKSFKDKVQNKIDFWRI